MRGKLYGVGVGPGDPELITLKAKGALEQADVIAVPRSPVEPGSTAHSIVSGFVRNKPVLELLFPMAADAGKLNESWNYAAKAVRRELDRGKDVAFITLGDPTVYSTFMYVYRILKSQGYSAEIVPGVPSFCASAAKAGVSLSEGTQTVAIVPGTIEPEKMDDILDRFDNIVFMKASAGWEYIKERLEARGLEKKVTVIQRCCMEGERVTHGMDGDMGHKPGYFTILLIKKKETE